ncbi:MAG: triose-phosphate isomerase [Coriobacteriales bacterium]|jgi:triosephosphate isomerase|nr:triose-phosphate isomerase [Coriobacteriales bacterium]
MSRKPIIAGNWKMNKTTAEATALAQDISYLYSRSYSGVDVVVCPPFTDLRSVRVVFGFDKAPVALGAQDVYWQKSGAFTGEVSPPMLKELGCEYCIIGHSERREHFGETDATVNLKARALIAEDIIPIICCGESLEIREAGGALSHVTGQIRAALEEIAVFAATAGVAAAAGGAALAGAAPAATTAADSASAPAVPAPAASSAGNIVIAYEPIWAIGTGRTATPEQAEEVCAAIRGTLAELYGHEAAEAVRILYGGSLKPANVAQFAALPNLDGGLIGGASLVADDFISLVQAFA